MERKSPASFMPFFHAEEKLGAGWLLATFKEVAEEDEDEVDFFFLRIDLDSLRIAEKSRDDFDFPTASMDAGTAVFAAAAAARRGELRRPKPVREVDRLNLPMCVTFI